MKPVSVLVYRHPPNNTCPSCKYGEKVVSGTFDNENYICWVDCTLNTFDTCPKYKQKLPIHLTQSEDDSQDTRDGVLW